MDRFKFRVFVKSEDRLITDVTGFVIDLKKEKIRIFRMNPDMKDGMSSELFMLDDVVIMQCTGLKDKSGTLIYEGDIVRFKEQNYKDSEVISREVYFDDELCEFGIRYSNALFHGQFSHEFEVIGNTHKHAHLLEA